MTLLSHIRTLKNAFYSTLTQHKSMHEFELNVRDAQYTRKVEHGSQFLNLPLHQTVKTKGLFFRPQYGLMVSGANISVSFSIVEDLLREIHKNTEEVINTGVPLLFSLYTPNWQFFEAADIPPVCESILREFNTKGQAFYSRVASLELLVDYLKPDVPTGALNPYTAEYAIVAAYLTGDKALFQEILQRKIQWFEKQSKMEWFRARFNRTVTALAGKASL